MYLQFLLSFNIVLGEEGATATHFEGIALLLQTSVVQHRYFVALYQCPRDFCPWYKSRIK